MTRPERIRTVQVITRLERGGAAGAVVALCEKLDRDRFDLTLICGPSRNPVARPDELARRLGIPVLACPHLKRPVRPLADLRALLWLRRTLRSLRPDVVHAHTSKAGALGRLAAGRVPVIYSPHGHLFYGYHGKLGTALVVLAERALAPRADRIAVLTETSRAEHLGRRIGRFDQFVTVPSGVDLERFGPDEEARSRVRAEFGFGAGIPVVGWAGRFTHVKGPDVFVEAAARIAAGLPEAGFVLAGDGELRAETERRAEELGLANRCRFPGHRDDVAGLLNACDVFVLTSRNEGQGLAVVEAMACGTPVVATDVAGVGEVLLDGRAGVLARPGDPRAVADAVTRLLRDEPRRRELERLGLERARDFALDAMVRRFENLYEESAQTCGSRP